MAEWSAYIPEGFEPRFAPGVLVLDIGCGPGEQMQDVQLRGSRAIGVDIDPDSLHLCSKLGLSVVRAQAERIPLSDGSVDGVVCKVVLPYTQEEQVIGEIARVLRPGGHCYLVCHGAGYYLKYLLQPPTWRHRIYGLRTLVNTWIWMLTSLRLPGFLGDSIFQSRRRLGRYFQQNGLTIVQDVQSRRYWGFPVFTYQVVSKPARAGAPLAAVRGL
jgi:SAM-dependent methyltransferase